MNVFGKGVPEGGGSNRESSIPPGSVLGCGDSEENGIRRTKGAGRDVRVEKVCEVGGGLVVEFFMGVDPHRILTVTGVYHTVFLSSL